MELSREGNDKSSAPVASSVPAPSTGQTQEEQNAESNIPEKKSAKFKLSVLMLSIVIFVVAMDSVIVAAALPAIAAALHGSSLEAFWVGTSYLLAQTVGISHMVLFGAI